MEVLNNMFCVFGIVGLSIIMITVLFGFTIVCTAIAWSAVRRILVYFEEYFGVYFGE